MALPPEPLEELLPQASYIVEAEVTEIVKQPGPVSGPRVGEQLVKLKVKRVLRGDASANDDLLVRKPEAGYALRAGNQGPFLLCGAKDALAILGRYGPDTWPLERIERALR